MRCYLWTCRMAFFIVLSLHFLLTMIAAKIDENSEADVESFLTPGSKPFRMQKINDIWLKAEKRLSEKKLERLYKELRRQDENELKWKKIKANNGDEDGEIEAKNRRKLFKILEEFGLKQHFPYDDIVDNRSTKQAFGDRKLDALWEEARSRGTFDQHELEDLKIELSHYKQKIDEVNILKDNLDSEVSENSVMHDKRNANKEKLKKKLKTEQRDLKQLYNDLEVKVRGKKSEELFEDPRVKELWERALNGDFSVDQLASVKEELMHFERKIKKHESIEEQVEVAEKLLSDGNTHIKDKHDRLQKKLKEGEKYVEKMHHHLKLKIKDKEEL